MNLYIDKDNLISLMSQSTHELFADCIKAIKNQLDVSFNFKKEEVPKNDLLMAFLKLTTSGVGQTKKEFLEENVFPERPLKSNTANSFNERQLSSIYLLQDDDIDKLKNLGTVLIGKVGEEISLFKILFLNQNDYVFDKELRIGSAEFSNWDHLIPYSTPITDIIVIDPYILKNTEPDPKTIDVNLVKWLNCLCQKTSAKINIVIVYNPSEISYTIEDIRKKVMDSLNVTLGKKPTLTFVRTYREHDRSIITNYIRITGNTFTYWDVNGRQITKGKEITIKSLARLEYFENSFKALNDIQTIINEADNNHIEGDKISNYLKFK